MSGGSRGAVASGGLVVAGVGFLLTRSATAASTAGGTSAPFLVGKLPFLVVGLSLSLFGVVPRGEQVGADARVDRRAVVPARDGGDG
ncbi:hypothetical protein GJ632_20220, partial [Halogeometricum sp. CBA1124]|nr:hypothetical protein [Halogeometricum sp. CBA1124]